MSFVAAYIISPLNLYTFTTTFGTLPIVTANVMSDRVPIFLSFAVAPTATPWTKPRSEPWFMVIMALAVIGGLLLIVTTVLVFIFIRRRRRKKLSEGTVTDIVLAFNV